MKERLKYGEIYTAIQIENEEQTESDADTLLGRIALGDVFRLTLSNDHPTKGTLFCPDLLEARIKQVVWLENTNNEMAITFVILPNPPIGIKEGAHTMLFDENLVCSSLPPEMFEGGDEIKKHETNPQKKPRKFRGFFVGPMVLDIYYGYMV